MRLSHVLTSVASLALLAGCTSNSTGESEPAIPETQPPISDAEDASVKLTPPIAKRELTTIEQVGRTRVDPYHWMKDDNWQSVMKDPTVLRADIRDYLEAENAFTKASLEDPLEGLKEELFTEMRGRIKEDDSSLPSIDGPYAYLTRFRTGGEYPIIARKAAADIYNADAEDEILLDGDVMGKDKAYFSFNDVEHSPNHKIVAYAVDEQGSEYYTIRFKNLETGETLPDLIEQLRDELPLASRSVLDEGLRRYGYLDTQKHLYETTGYTLRATRHYDVRDGFPRIQAAHLPEGVSRVSYRIELASAVDFLLEEEAVSEALETGASS